MPNRRGCSEASVKERSRNAHGTLTERGGVASRAGRRPNHRPLVSHVPARGPWFLEGWFQLGCLPRPWRPETHNGTSTRLNVLCSGAWTQMMVDSRPHHPRS